MTGAHLLTLPAMPGGPRPFADLICFSRPPPMGAWSWCSSLRPLRLTPHPPRCARHLLLKEKAFGMAGYSAFPLRGRWHSEAVTDEVRTTPQGPARPGAPMGCNSPSIRMQEPGGRRGKPGNRGSRTPEREERTPTERGGYPRGVRPPSGALLVTFLA